MGEYYLIRPRLGDDHPNRNVLHCIRPRRQIVFRQVFRHTPGNAFWSGGGGGMAKREHTLKACSCDGARRRSWKGALKAPTYLLVPVRLSNARGKDSHREASPCIILTYSNLQQPKVDFSFQDPVFSLSWRAELELNIQ